MCCWRSDLSSHHNRDKIIKCLLHLSSQNAQKHHQRRDSAPVWLSSWVCPRQTEADRKVVDEHEAMKNTQLRVFLFHGRKHSLMWTVSEKIRCCVTQKPAVLIFRTAGGGGTHTALSVEQVFTSWKQQQFIYWKESWQKTTEAPSDSDSSNNQMDVGCTENIKTGLFKDSKLFSTTGNSAADKGRKLRVVVLTTGQTKEFH